MIAYDDALTLQDARSHYFQANDFGDGGYDSPVVKLKAGPIPLILPNNAARVRAVRFHDLHHVVTGYDTSWVGEGEIGAWEVASSCADHIAAWFLNLSAMGIGLFLAPGRMFRAFVRGRRSRNLYRETWSDALLTERVGAMRERLALDRATGAADARDVLAFAGFTVASLLTLLLAFAVLTGPIAGIVVLVRHGLSLLA